MTEEEAKTKWCPMVRMRAVFREPSNGFSYNRSAVENTYPCRCVGSACMMWRELAVPRNQIGIDKNQQPIMDGVNHGYCGLAGKP